MRTLRNLVVLLVAIMALTMTGCGVKELNEKIHSELETKIEEEAFGTSDMAELFEKEFEREGFTNVSVESIENGYVIRLTNKGIDYEMTVSATGEASSLKQFNDESHENYTELVTDEN